MDQQERLKTSLEVSKDPNSLGMIYLEALKLEKAARQIKESALQKAEIAFLAASQKNGQTVFDCQFFKAYLPKPKKVEVEDFDEEGWEKHMTGDLISADAEREVTKTQAELEKARVLVQAAAQNLQRLQKLGDFQTTHTQIVYSRFSIKAKKNAGKVAGFLCFSP